ncbi:unnamed protein product [Ectocarpus sp. 12 AP-2014]
MREATRALLDLRLQVASNIRREDDWLVGSVICFAFRKYVQISYVTLLSAGGYSPETGNRRACNRHMTSLNDSLTDRGVPYTVNPRNPAVATWHTIAPVQS